MRERERERERWLMREIDEREREILGGLMNEIELVTSECASAQDVIYGGDCVE